MAGQHRHSPFGSIEKRDSKTGTTYRASFANPRFGKTPHEPKRISATFPRKTEASEWLAKERTDISRGIWESPLQRQRREEDERQQAQIDGYTFGQYAAEYMNALNIKPSTRRKYTSNLHIHLLPHWGDTPLKHITTTAVNEWVFYKLAQREKADGSITVYEGARKKAFELFRAILNGAVKDELIPVNPCTTRHAKFVNRISNTQRHAARALEPDQINALLHVLPDNMKMLTYLLAAHGLRLGEARELRRSDIDLEAATIRITRAAADNGAALTVGTPKTKESIRTIYVTQEEVAMLKNHLEQLPLTGKDALVFPSPSDPHQHRSEVVIRENIQRAATKLGFGAVSPHDFRHTYATLAARSEGITVKDLQEALGHSTPTMSIRYMKTSEAQQRKLADGVASQLASARLVSVVGVVG